MTIELPYLGQEGFQPNPFFHPLDHPDILGNATCDGKIRLYANPSQQVVDSVRYRDMQSSQNVWLVPALPNQLGNFRFSEHGAGAIDPDFLSRLQR